MQALRIEHVIPRLRDRYILSKEDLELIDRGSTQQEKTRLLLDLLPSKGWRPILLLRYAVSSLVVIADFREGC